MKRMITGVLLCACLYVLAGEEIYMSSGSLYQVYSDLGQEHADLMVAKLEAYSEIYESFLHYGRSDIDTVLKVKIKGDKETYDSYVAEFVEEPKDSFLFLQYTDISRSELIGYDSGDGSFEQKLIHHSFIQYLKTFIPNPPLWLQKGMAIYLEKSFFSEMTATAQYAINLDWTKTLKKYLIEETGASRLPVSVLLALDVETANEHIQEFYAQSWGVVHFLINSPNKNYNRVLWEILNSLSPEADREENQNLAIEHGFGWISKEGFVKDYSNYVAELKTFSDLVKEGIALYSMNSFQESLSSFNRAITIDDSYDVPYYYLGLLHYELKDYPMAEYYYQESLERGSDPSLTYYAMGILAYSDSSYEKAIDYLTMVLENDPEGYGTKAQELIDRIESETTGASSGA